MSGVTLGQDIGIFSHFFLKNLIENVRMREFSLTKLYIDLPTRTNQIVQIKLKCGGLYKAHCNTLALFIKNSGFF